MTASPDDLRQAPLYRVLHALASGETTSAARVLALLMQAAELHERQGTPVRLMYSDALKDAAHAEAAGNGQTFDEFKAALAAELGGGGEPAPLSH